MRAAQEAARCAVLGEVDQFGWLQGVGSVVDFKVLGGS
jgi:hypothetical protein